MKTQIANLYHFLSGTWRDWLLLGSIGSVTAAIYQIHPKTSNMRFALFTPQGTLYRPDLAYPYFKPLFSSLTAGILSVCVPLLGLALFQFGLQFSVTETEEASSNDFHIALLGLAYAMVTGTAAQVVLKKTIGGFRPHFLAICFPEGIPESLVPNATQAGWMVSPSVCVGNDLVRLRYALESFPSGHSEAAFAGFGFLAIYLFVRLVWDEREESLSGGHRSYWRMVVVVAPLLFAIYLSATLVRQYHHHVGDAVFGAGLGLGSALLGYFVAFGGLRERRSEDEGSQADDEDEGLAEEQDREGESAV